MGRSDDEQHPLQNFMTTFGQAMQTNIRNLQQNLDRAGQEFGAHVGNALLNIRHHLTAAAAVDPSTPLHPMLASLSSSALSKTVSRLPQHLCDIALMTEEIKMRLSGIPIYAVVNKKNDFILVSGDHDDRQMGLFFFSKGEAEHLIDTIKKQTPKLGKQARVMTTTLDRVYEFIRTPSSEKDSGEADDVAFRFVPDTTSVEAALDLFRHAGMPANSFPGVPVFQAEGLTVKAEKGVRFTPLFFAKEDLDTALGTAFSAKEAQLHKNALEQAAQARAELETAREEVDATEKKDGKKKAQKKVDELIKKVQTSEKKVKEVEKEHRVPRVDVGTLEEVLAKMEADQKHEWADVMFVAANSLAGSSSSSK
jgi:hypothetical protein